MKITDEIRAALRAVVHEGSTVQLAAKIGLSHTTILRWLSGSTQSIHENTWMTAVYPVIKPYLKNGSPSPVKSPASSSEPVERAFEYVTHESPERLEMAALLREKIGILEERLKLAAETVAAKGTVIREKNKRINELELEAGRLKKELAGEKSKEGALPYGPAAKTQERMNREFYGLFSLHYFGSGLKRSVKECYDLIIKSFPKVSVPSLEAVEVFARHEEATRERGNG